MLPGLAPLFSSQSVTASPGPASILLHSKLHLMIQQHPSHFSSPTPTEPLLSSVTARSALRHAPSKPVGHQPALIVSCWVAPLNPHTPASFAPHLLFPCRTLPTPPGSSQAPLRLGRPPLHISLLFTTTPTPPPHPSPGFSPLQCAPSMTGCPQTPSSGHSLCLSCPSASFSDLGRHGQPQDLISGKNGSSRPSPTLPSLSSCSFSIMRSCTLIFQTLSNPPPFQPSLSRIHVWNSPITVAFAAVTSSSVLPLSG